jgi:hypothetical protein
MSETERPSDHSPSEGSSGPAGIRRPSGPPPGLDPEVRAARDARIRSHEQVYMRRGMIFVVVASILFITGVWGVSKQVSERGPRPVGPRDVSHAMRGLYNAAYADGIRMFESAIPAELAGWLTEHVAPGARVPDLSAAGLTPTGVRALNLGEGWGMIQYRDRAGPRGDVLAVIAPHNAVQVPAEATAQAVDGGKAWVLEDNGLTFAWAESGGADWVLVTARDAPGALAAARAMLGASG